MAEHFGCTPRQLQRYNAEKFKIKRTGEQIAEFNQRNLERKYGEKFALKIPEFNEKMKTTYEEKTGYRNPSLNPEVVEKRKQVFIEKYGVENPFQAEECKQKSIETLRKKFNLENITNISQVKKFRELKNKDEENKS